MKQKTDQISHKHFHSLSREYAQKFDITSVPRDQKRRCHVRKLGGSGQR